MPALPPFLARLLRADVPATAMHAGLRAGTATVVPIVAAALTGREELVWAAIGGWLGSFADTGGAYRVRARSMAAFVVGGALSLFVGSLVGDHRVLAVVLVGAWATGGALLRVGGDASAALGTLFAASFLAGLATPVADVRTGAVHAGLLAAGALSSMVLALGIWPVRPYGPAWRATADVVRALAVLARAMRDAYAAALADAPDAVADDARAAYETRTDARFAALARTHHARVRAAIEQARTVVAQTRRTRLGTSRRAEDLVVLLDLCDELFGTLIAAADAAEAVALAPASDPGVRRAVAAVLARIPDALGAVARAVPGMRRPPSPPASLPPLDRALVALWHAVEPETWASDAATASGEVGGGRARHAAALLEQAVTLVEGMAETAVSLLSGTWTDDARARPVRGASLRPWTRLRAAARGAAARAGALVRALASPDALTTRYALRLGLTLSVAQAIGGVLHLQRGQWLTTTVLLVLQPYAGTTWQRGLARVVGTVLGGIVAAVLAALLHDRLMLAAVMFPLSVAAVAVRTVDYALFTFFLTPIFVLLAEPAQGDWQVAAVRVVDTIAGGALAVAASRLLWPTFEHRTLPVTLADLLEAQRANFRLAARVAAVGTRLAPSEHDVPDADHVPGTLTGAQARARRRVGLAANAADAALERWLAEPRGRWRDAEALMAVLAQSRRLGGAISGLATVPLALDSTHEALDTRAAALDALMADLAAAVRDGRLPAPPGEVLLATAAGALRATAEHSVVAPAAGPLARVARHALGLHGAVARLLGSDRRASPRETAPTSP